MFQGISWENCYIASGWKCVLCWGNLNSGCCVSTGGRGIGFCMLAHINLKWKQLADGELLYLVCRMIVPFYIFALYTEGFWISYQLETNISFDYFLLNLKMCNQFTISYKSISTYASLCKKCTWNFRIWKQISHNLSTTDQTHQRMMLGYQDFRQKLMHRMIWNPFHLVRIPQV